MKQPFVQLNSEEIAQGAFAGLMRMTNAIKRGDFDKNSPGYVAHHSDPDNAWHHHIEGALAEMAVAKYYETFWSSGDRANLDIGDWEIRTTTIPYGCLIVRKVDIEVMNKANKLFFLCVGRHGGYRIVGYIQGSEAIKDPRYFKDPTGKGREPAWFIPQTMLTPIE